MEKRMRALMKKILSLRFLGNVVFALGVLEIIHDFVRVSYFSFPFNLGIVLGNIAIVLVGLVASMSANEFKKLEERLERLQARQEAE